MPRLEGQPSGFRTLLKISPSGFRTTIDVLSHAREAPIVAISNLCTIRRTSPRARSFLEVAFHHPTATLPAFHVRETFSLVPYPKATGPLALNVCFLQGGRAIRLACAACLLEITTPLVHLSNCEAPIKKTVHSSDGQNFSVWFCAQCLQPLLYIRRRKRG